MVEVAHSTCRRRFRGDVDSGAGGRSELRADRRSEYVADDRFLLTQSADLSRKLMNYIIRSYAKDAKPSLDLHQPTAGWFPNNRDASVVY